MPKLIRIEKTTIDKIAKLSAELPQKEASDYPLRKSIELLLPQINSLQTKGYSIEEISKIYSQNGLEISATTMRHYLNDLNKTPTIKLAEKSKPEIEPAKKSKSKKVTPATKEQKTTEPSIDVSERIETHSPTESSVESSPPQVDITSKYRSSVKAGFNLVDMSNL